jgi:hypothetical protein
MKHTTGRPVTSIGRSPGRVMLSIGVLALLGAGVACKAREKAPAAAPQAPAADTAADAAPAEPSAPAPVAAAPVEVARPSCDQFQITENGAGAVLIGDPRDSVRTRCRVLSDSTAVDGDGMVQGRVVLGVGGSTLVAQIANDRVNGIFATDSLFRTLDGLGPGTLVRSMLQLPGAVVLEGVHDLSLVVAAHCGLYFQIPKPAVLPEAGGKWADVVTALPPDTRIERVVVRGCR